MYFTFKDCSSLRSTIFFISLLTSIKDVFEKICFVIVKLVFLHLCSSQTLTTQFRAGDNCDTIIFFTIPLKYMWLERCLSNYKVIILAEDSNSTHAVHRAVQNPLQFYFQGFRRPSIILVGTRHTMMHRHTYIFMTNSPLRISLILTQINYYLTLHN